MKFYLHTKNGFCRRVNKMKWNNKGYQFEKLGEVFQRKSRIYIYGAGENGKILYDNISFMECIEAFVDNDKEKQKYGYLGKKVISPRTVRK